MRLGIYNFYPNVHVHQKVKFACQILGESDKNATETGRTNDKGGSEHNPTM